jgi:hypothetical protein
MFMAFGLGFMIAARDYDMGSAGRMGPAYSPAVLGALLALLGAVIFTRAFFLDSGRVPRIAVRQPALILASVTLFALALEPLGLVIAVLILIVLGALGGREVRWREVGLLYVALIAFSLLVFHVGLGLPFRLWPAFVAG